MHDMRALPECFEAESFDLVVDKAGTDGAGFHVCVHGVAGSCVYTNPLPPRTTTTALCTDEGDPWNPHASVIQDLDSICEGVLRVLKPGGRFVSISFQQPHFRRKYLLGTHAGKEYPWELVVQDIGACVYIAGCLFRVCGLGVVIDRLFDLSIKTPEQRAPRACRTSSTRRRSGKKTQK